MDHSATDIIAQARAAGRGALDEAAGKALLTRFGMRTPQSCVVADAQAGIAAASAMTAPFVVKVVSPDILHKSDAGGVALHLADSAAVGAAIDRMGQRPAIAGKRLDGWLVEEMASAGVEMVIGGLRDPQFGPMVMVGLGGDFR